MNKILTIAAILISFCSYGQIFQKSTTNNAWNRVKADSAMYAPLDTFQVRPATQLGQPVGDSGRIAYKNRRLYYHDGLSWISLAGSSVTDTGFVRNSTALQRNSSYHISNKGIVDYALYAGLNRASNSLSSADTAYFFGNSITLGSNASPSSNRWTSLTISTIGGFERNFGIGSSTMQQGTPPRPLGARSMIDTLDGVPYKSPRAKFISIAYGLNDMGCNQPDYDTVKFKQAYREVLDTMTARGWNMADILILSPTWTPDSAYGLYATINGGMGKPTRQRHLQYVDACRAIAAERGTMYIDLYQAMLNNSSLISSDSLHPNNSGHLFIAQKVVNYLKTAFSTNNNYALTVDSSQVTLNAPLFVNGNYNITNLGNNYLINNNTAAFTNQLAVIDQTYNYGMSNYRGGQFLASSGLFNIRSVGRGTVRATDIVFGTANEVGGDKNFVRIDTIGRVTIDSLPNALIMGTNSTGRIVAKTLADIGAAPSTGSSNYIRNGTSPQTADYNITGNATIGGLYSTSNSEGLRINNSAGFTTFYNTAGSTITGFFQMDAANYARIRTSINIPFLIETNSNERMRITGSGLIGVATAIPSSTMHIEGSFATAITTVTGTTSMGATHHTVRVNNSSDVAINLPAASTCPGRMFIIKKVSNNAFTVTITGSGAETIDGSNTNVISAFNASVMIQCDGITWSVL